MKILSVLLLALIICSIVGWSEAQFTDVSCTTSKECWSVCQRLHNTSIGKCMNKKCRCYS
uniref:Potassium channel toxin alpha-KTx 1.12 n=1 Tax=Leiurus hebraeus TaxID=2899558 RepID=KAX1C_LEIHE|nr:RecName: Full=Potassium channel toxin alpha-KTx 1.12; AltName: Full=Charybdotoxin b; Short=ChTx-b; Flags: Precursor [Leiurus quinquestriatus hebraeus]